MDNACLLVCVCLCACLCVCLCENASDPICMYFTQVYFLEKVLLLIFPHLSQPFSALLFLRNLFHIGAAALLSQRVSLLCACTCACA